MQKTILMIHGMQGGGWHWEKYKAFFEAKGYHCITPDLRYHEEGAITPHPLLGTTSLNDYLDDLEALLETLPKDTILMGHSMGGLLALMLSSRGYGSKAAVITPAIPCGIFALTYTVIKGFLSIIAHCGFWKKPFRQSFKEARYTVLEGLNMEEAKRFYERFSFESGRVLFEIGFWFLDKHKTTCIERKTLTNPVLIIGAVQDKAVPITVTRKMARRYGTTYYEYEDHSHAILGEKGWDKIASDILEWVESI